METACAVDALSAPAGRSINAIAQFECAGYFTHAAYKACAAPKEPCYSLPFSIAHRSNAARPQSQRVHLLTSNVQKLLSYQFAAFYKHPMHYFETGVSKQSL